MTLDELRVKLNEEPIAEEISFLPDGARYLSIDVVRKKTDLLFNRWEHRNFIFSSLIYGKETYASGTIDVLIWFDKNTFRYVSGAATIKLSDYPNNPHFAATLKSLCIVNALSQEYICFGKNLNQGLFSEVPEQEPKGKHFPTAIEVQKLKIGVKNNDVKIIEELTTMYDFKYAEPALLETSLDILQTAL